MTDTNVMVSGTPTVVSLAGRIQDGSSSAVARGLTLVERGSREADELLNLLWRQTGNAHVLGVTGPAGSGKSTLVARLAQEYGEREARIGILAIDPSSAYSGGAILGDRIRMGELAGNQNVYIRSMASRGATGGLSRAVLDGIALLDAAGFDVVILETVGVGQAEIDIMNAAHTVVVVSVPGLGDDVQAIKAGLLEIADVHVVNKADRPGADLTVKQLRDSSRLAHRRPGAWSVPIVKTSASTGEGVAELLACVDEHRAWLGSDGNLRDAERRNAAMRLEWALTTLVRDGLRTHPDLYEKRLDAVLARDEEPRRAAARLLSAIAHDSIDLNVSER